MAAVGLFGILALAGCGGEPPLDVNKGNEPTSKLEGATAEKAGFTSEGLSTGYKGGDHAGTDPAK